MMGRAATFSGRKATRAGVHAAEAEGCGRPNGRALAPPAYGIDFVDRPRLSVRSFSVAAPMPASRQGCAFDKSFQSSEEEQDKILSTGLFQTENSGAAPGVARGIGIEVDASTWFRTLVRTGLGAVGGGAVGAGVGSAVPAVGTAIGAVAGGIAGGLAAGLSAEYQWTQTIDTNAPLHGAVSPYVDPHPNDDPEGAPFYYTGAEAKRFGNHFVDHPKRVPDPARALNWDAVLSITSVHAGQRVWILESLKYGFTVNTDGTVTPRAPTAASGGDVTRHINTLGGEFADWKFSTGWL